MLSPVPQPGSAVRIATAILNAGSGAQRQADVAETLARVFAERGVELRVQTAKCASDIYGLARVAVSKGHPMVLAGGGDGTISAVASVLAGSHTALAVVPLGTFNYFARNLGIPLEVEAAVRVCLEGELRTVSLGEVNGRVFLNNASLGLYPAMLREREKTYRRWGRSQVVAYLSAISALLRVRRYLQVEMSVGSERQQFRTPLVFAAHNPHQVESFRVAGADCPQRGKLAFYILPPLSRAGLLRVAWRMLLRRLDPGEDFHLVCADAAQVQTRRPLVHVAYDGEIEVLRAPLYFRLRPDALQVIVPRTMPTEAA